MRTSWIPVTALAFIAVACQKGEPAKVEPGKAVAAIEHKVVDPVLGNKEGPTPLTNAPPALPSGPVTLAAPDKLIPGDATLLAHVDLQGLAASPLWSANKALLDADPEVKKQLDALAACNMPMTGFKALDLGVGADGVNVAVVVTGAGVGKPANISCLQDQLKGENFRVEERGGTKLMVLEGGDAHGYMVNDDTLAFVSKGWDTPVRNLMLGTGASVRDGGLKDVLAQADQSKHVWFAGTVSPQLSKLTDAIPGGLSGLQSIAGSLDLTAGLALVMSFGMDNADRANNTLAQVKKQFADVKPMAGMLGVPSTAVDRVIFESKENAVTMTASLSMDEINNMRTAVEKSRSAPGPATTPSGPDSGPGSASANNTGGKGSKGSGMPTVGGNSAPTGAAPTPSGNGVPASDPPPTPAPKAPAAPTPITPPAM